MMTIKAIMKALSKLDQNVKVEVMSPDGEDVSKLTTGCQINLDLPAPGGRPATSGWSAADESAYGERPDQEV